MRVNASSNTDHTLMARDRWFLFRCNMNKALPLAMFTQIATFFLKTNLKKASEYTFIRENLGKTTDKQTLKTNWNLFDHNYSLFLDYIEMV